MQFINKLKHLREDTVIFISIVISTAFVCLYLTKLADVYSVYQQTTDALSNNTIHFLAEPDGYIDFSEVADYEEKNFALLIKKSDAQPLYQVIYSDMDWPLAEGRNFSRDEFFNGTRNAVIGDAVNQIMQTEPFVIDENIYHVIGKRSHSDDILSKYMVLYSDGAISETLSKNEFIIESDSPSRNNRILKKVTKLLETQGFRINIIRIVRPSVNDFIHMENRWVDFLSLFLVVYCTLNFSVLLFWLLGYQEQAYVYKLLGMKTIRRDIYLAFIKIFSMAYIVDALICFGASADKVTALPLIGSGYLILLFPMLLALSLEMEILIHHNWMRSTL